MLIYRTGSNAPVLVRAWFGGNSVGDLKLSQMFSGTYALVAANPRVEDELRIQLQRPEDGRLRLQLRAILASIDGQAAPLFVEVTQGGAVLQGMDAASGDANGQLPDAPFNSPVYHHLYVAFQ